MNLNLVLRTLLFTMLGPGSITVGLPYLLLVSSGGIRFHEPVSVRAAGLLLTAFGAGVYLACAWDFASAGKGTPAPYDPPRFLVSRRLYRLVRNPMYVGVECVLLGEAILFASPAILIYAAAVWLGFHLWAVFFEEPRLRKKFGAAYAAYCAAVPRWMPRLRAGGQ